MEGYLVGQVQHQGLVGPHPVLYHRAFLGPCPVFLAERHLCEGSQHLFVSQLNQDQDVRNVVNELMRIDRVQLVKFED